MSTVEYWINAPGGRRSVMLPALPENFTAEQELQYQGLEFWADEYGTKIRINHSPEAKTMPMTCSIIMPVPSSLQWHEDGDVLQLWDAETLLFEVNAANPARDQLIAAYRAGRERGRVQGRIELQHDFKRLLDTDNPF